MIDCIENLAIVTEELNDREKKMSEITIDSAQLKELFKSAIVEMLRENKKEVSDFLAEVIEDVAMERAIAEGETTERVSREAIFKLLEQKV